MKKKINKTVHRQQPATHSVVCAFNDEIIISLKKKENHFLHTHENLVAPGDC
jgi:hypothetical protein